MDIYSPLAVMADYAKFYSSLGRLSNDYNHMFLYSFKNTIEQNRGIYPQDLFYEKFLENLDNIYEDELKSKRFTLLLRSYIDSLIDLRKSFKDIGIPITQIDQFLYEYKKSILNFSSAKELEQESIATPSEVIYSKKKIEVIHYLNNNLNAIPVLLVYAQINRFNIMDLEPKKSVVKNLILQGFDVYVIHWGYSGLEDDSITVDDYIKCLDESTEIIKKKTASEKISLIGYCWGGILSIAYSALFNDKIQNLTILATPVDFEKDTSLLSLWAKDIDANKMMEEFGHMDPLLLDISFIMRNPSRNFDKYLKLFSQIHDEPFLKNFFLVERWLHNTPPIPGEYFKKIINDGYQKNLLIKNQMQVLSKTVDLKKINMPTLTVVAEKDDLVAPQSTLEFQKYISSKEKDILSYQGGHVGLCISGHAQKILWPQIAEWIKNNSFEEKTNEKINLAKKSIIA